MTCLFDRVHHVGGMRDRVLFELLGIGHRNVRAGDSQDGRIEAEKSAFSDRGGDLGPDSAGAAVFLDDYQPRGFLHRLNDRADVERFECARVDNLDAHAVFFFQRRRRLQRHVDHSRVRDDGHVASLALYVGHAERYGEISGW